MKKTIYVKEGDAPLWERAQTELGDSISSVFADCLRERLARAERKPEEMQKITLTFWNENNEPVIKKSFFGRWLVGGAEAGLRALSDPMEQQTNVSSLDAFLRSYVGREYSVAQTAKGNIVVYTRHVHDERAPEMEVYKNFAEMRDDIFLDGEYPVFPRNVVAEAASKLGEPYEIDLDI